MSPATELPTTELPTTELPAAAGTGPEFTDVEHPFLDQLINMGWKFTTGSVDHEHSAGRESFREVLLLSDLRTAMRNNNLDPQGQPWLDDGRITQAINELQRLGVAKLLEANAKATALLLNGTVVDGVQGWEQGRGRTIHYIDWEHPERNTFRAVNQFKVACPAGQPHKHIIPDIVLFVNGIPLVVVEAKSPTISAPMESAVDQLQRYANRRRGLGIVDVNEGNERLFHYTQFMVATSNTEARVGTISSHAVHYLEWKDTSPTAMADVAEELNKAGESLTSQEKLVAGMLRPEVLLDIVRHFTLFMEIAGRTIKIVCRYQQYRAAQLAFRRLLTGKTRLEDGEHDRRGGIIWHTQGSGKSLTMVFLIRKMRSNPTLRGFKIVVVTDRRALQKQLAATATMTGESFTIVKSKTKGHKSLSAYEVLQETLAQKGKGLIFAMIQKYRGELLDADGGDVDEEDDLNDSEDEATGATAENHSPSEAAESESGSSKKQAAKTAPLPELNTDTSILVLVDEAHRSHTNTAHANLMRALPNCAKIGFTGTPIIMRAKGQTAEIFGEFIDRYTIRESEEDGATVPILYEGRTTEAAVQGGGKLDQIFEDMLVKRTPEELEVIKQKYASKGHVMEAEALIAAKAENMLQHYVENILPNGFKAQLVAVSRRATIRYDHALRKAQTDLVEELEALHPSLIGLNSGDRPGGAQQA